MKKFIVVCLLTLATLCNAQIIISEKLDPNAKDYSNAFKVIPEKPKAGDKIKITFDAKSTSLENATEVAATYVVYSEKIDEFNSIEMKNNNGIWETEIIIPLNAAILGFMFESKETYFTNNAKAYFVRTYDAKGNETVRSVLGIMAAQLIWGPRTIGLAVNREAKLEDLELLNRILVENPELKAKNMNLLLRSTIKNRKKGDNEALKKLLEDYRNNYNNSEEDIKNLITGYNAVSDRENARAIFYEGFAKYPSSEYFIVSTEIQKISAEKDVNKQFDMLEKLLKQFPSNIDVERYLSTVAHFSVKANDPTKILLFSQRFKPYINAEIAISISKNIDKDTAEPKLLALKTEMAKYAVEFAEKEFTNPSRKKTEYASDKAWYQLRRNSLVWAYINLGNILTEFNKVDEALKNYDKMAKYFKVNDYKDLEMMTNYSAALVKAKRFDEAEKIIDHAVITEKVTSDMKETLRKIYLNKYGNEEKYKSYISTFEEKLMERIKEEFKPKLVKTTAPNFTLKDLDGKTVSLSDYKGKLVILDFWATWCAPCQASFPGMQKAIEKFASDKNVVFLFVNTSEQEEGIEKKIVKWKAAKKYSFQILLDKEYKVRDAYEARSIPHKLFIDKDGNIRLRSVGYSGGADKLVDEITAVISLLKEDN